MRRFPVSAAPQPSPTPALPRRAPAKVWFFRAFTALVIPTLVFLGLEVFLRLAGIGHPAKFLIPDDQPGYYRTNPDYLSLFLPENFALRPLNFRVSEKKQANTVRIVVLGESAAQGVPVPAFAFAPQLRALLRARYPDKTIEVINTGVVAINSHVVYQIARETAKLSPDLVVVYLGNNEVVGPYGPGSAYLSAMRPLWVIRFGTWVRTTRLGQAVAGVMEKISSLRQPPTEWGGMAMFVNHAVRGDDPRLEEVYRNFEANLRDIVRVATGAGAKILLCTVVSNLKDSPPFLSLNRRDLTASERDAWRQAFDRGRVAWKLGENAAAQVALEEAWRIDPQYADTAFMLGDLDLQAGKVDSARIYFLSAQRWDALRFRPDPRLNEIVRAVVRSQPAVGLVDAARLMGSDPASTARPAGREQFLEHVHFNWEGNHQLARLLAEGTEAALFADQPAGPHWLDSSGCARALAWTPQGQLRLLQKTAEIVRQPPFTNQLTYTEDQAKLARDIARASSDAQNRVKLVQAKEVVSAAMANDPDNPDLALIAQEIEHARGDAAGALSHARRANQLLPIDSSRFAEEASLLAQLGRFDEAESVLEHAARATGARDLLAPSFAALYSLMNRHAAGRECLDRAIERNPSDRKYRLRRGMLARTAGDNMAAEADFRAILNADPSNQDALEELVSVLGVLDRPAEVEKESLAVAEQQMHNQQNNLRVANIHETRGDEAEAARFLVAAQASGPGLSAIELRIARKLYQLRRREEMLLHLAQAKRLSIIEEDPESTEEISRLIEHLRSEKH